MPRMGNRIARELRDQRMIELYAAGTPLKDIAKEFNLTETSTYTAVYRHPEDLEKATKRNHAILTATHRRNENLAAKIVERRLGTMPYDEAISLRPHELDRISAIAERAGKQANLAEGLATERTETMGGVTIVVRNEDAAKELANGVAGNILES
jgi:hypothetical protein